MLDPDDFHVSLDRGPVLGSVYVTVADTSTGQDLAFRLAAAALGVSFDEPGYGVSSTGAPNNRRLWRFIPTSPPAPVYKITVMDPGHRLVAEVIQVGSGRWAVAFPNGTLFGDATYRYLRDAMWAAGKLAEDGQGPTTTTPKESP